MKNARQKRKNGNAPYRCMTTVRIPHAEHTADDPREFHKALHERMEEFRSARLQRKSNPVSSSSMVSGDIDLF